MPKRDDKDWIGKLEDERKGLAAAQRHLSRASRPPSELNEPVRRKYAQQALERESGLLASTSLGRRNHQLNVSAMKLAQLVPGGWLDQGDIDNALESACYANGYIQEHDIVRFKASLRSGTNKGLSEPRDLSEVGTQGIQEYIAIDAPAILKADHVHELEGDFWTSRESLRTIYVAAMSGMAAPWAVLGCCAAKVLAMAPPHIVLPDIIGGPGSLNWFCALAAVSGGGKGAALQVMDRLIKSTVIQKNIGSGEGMIDAYKRPRDKDVEDDHGGIHESIMFVADEIDSFAAHQSRSGATILPTLRSAFSGVTLGASTKASGGFHLPAQSYRLTLIIGAQPSRASAILDDSYGGTPQRFMWFPATDSRIDSDRPLFPGELTVPNELTHDAFKYDTELIVPEVAERAIVAARVKSQRGEGDPLDSHRLFCQEKFAYALALIDGRDKMTLEDWQLATIAMKVSDYTRAWVMAGQEDAIREDAEKQGRTQGYASAAAEQTKQASALQTVNRVATRVLAHIKEAGEKGVSQGELNRKLPGRDRGYLMSALTSLDSAELVMQLDRKWLIHDVKTKAAHDDEAF